MKLSFLLALVLLTFNVQAASLQDEPVIPKYKYVPGKAVIEYYLSNKRNASMEVFETGVTNRRVYEQGLGIDFRKNTTTIPWNMPAVKISSYIYIDQAGEWSISVTQDKSMAELKMDDSTLVKMGNRTINYHGDNNLATDNKSIRTKLIKGWHQITLFSIGGKGRNQSDYRAYGTASVSLLGPSEFEARKIDASMTHIRIRNPEYQPH